MGTTRGQIVRLVGGANLVLGIVLGGGVIASPRTEAAADCFVEQATISDHSGTIYGTDGDDVIVANGGNNTIYGFGGNDLICSGDGDDWVSGGYGKDKIDGGAQDDTLYGTTGKDVLKGGSGNDALYGDSNYDTCQSGAGFDYVDWSCETWS